MLPETLVTKKKSSSSPIVYTIDDLRFMPDDGKKYEIIGGELFVSRAPHLNHQLLISNIVVAIGIYLRGNPIGKIIPEPGVIFSKKDSVIPDIIFSTHETIEKNVVFEGKHEGKFVAAPDLVIEILSFGKQDVDRDRIYKRKIYGGYGVKEYWIVDARFNSIEVYQLENESLELSKKYKIENEIASPLLPNFKLPLTEVFRF